MAHEPYPSALEVRRHEVRRMQRLAPIVMTVVAVTVTTGAYVTQLPAWAWNLLVIPMIAVPLAVLSTAAEIALVPRVRRRFPRVSAVPVMVGVRWLSALAIVSLVVAVGGPRLVAAGVWWPWLPEWLPRAGAAIGLIVGIAVAVYDRVYFQLQASFAELERRRSLERFLAREIVDRILAGLDLPSGGERRVVTVLFADLRDSTSIAEGMSGPEVMALLNGYVGAMAGAVFENGGMIDKYLGDGVMGVFGVLPDADEGAAAATRAALAIRSRLAQLNCERRDRGESAIRHGVGIHTGEVVLGAVGIPERSDYTAVGDAVNTASRLEALTKQHAVDVMLSEETVRRLPPGEFGVCSLGPAMLRGRRAQILVYQLM